MNVNMYCMLITTFATVNVHQIIFSPFIVLAMHGSVSRYIPGYIHRPRLADLRLPLIFDDVFGIPGRVSPKFPRLPQPERLGPRQKDQHHRPIRRRPPVPLHRLEDLGVGCCAQLQEHGLLPIQEGNDLGQYGAWGPME